MSRLVLPLPSRLSMQATRTGIPMLCLLVALVAVPGDAEEQVATREVAGSESRTESSHPGDSRASRVVTETVAAADRTQTHDQSIQQLLTRLESADQFLRSTARYSARFTQQVRKDGRLLNPEQIALKVQHEPFAVFLQWERDGQQALYVDGQHDNKLLVHPTRGFGRLRRVWILAPETGLAMRGALRPVTELGMLNMVRQLRGYHREHILNSHCTAEQMREAEQPLTRFVLSFDTPGDNPHYARTHLWLCDRTHMPRRIENYSWTADAQPGPLLERYDYSDVQLDANVTAADFDRHNKAYSF